MKKERISRYSIETSTTKVSQVSYWNQLWCLTNETFLVNIKMLCILGFTFMVIMKVL